MTKAEIFTEIKNIVNGYFSRGAGEPYITLKRMLAEYEQDEKPARRRVSTSSDEDK